MERLFREPRRQDPYRATTKLSGLPQCPECRSIAVKGCWYKEDEGRKKLKAEDRQKLSSTPPKELCPACRQLKERYAEAVVELHGDAWIDHRQAIEETIFNTERIARSRNDQERVLWHQTYRNVTKYYVTLPDLARQIGRVLGRTFKGKVVTHRSSEEPYLRVVWDSDLSSLMPARKILPRSGRSWRGRGTRLTSSQGTDTLTSKGKGKRSSR